MPDKKYNVSVSNGVHKQRLGKLQKVFVKCNNYIPLSKKTHPDVNIGFSTFCDLRPKCCVLADSKRTHSVYVCSSHQNVMLLVDVMDWSKTWSRRSFTILRATNASFIGLNPVLALQLWKNFLIRNSAIMKMIRNLITVIGTLRIEQYWQPLQSPTKNTKRFWLMLLMI